MSFLPQVKQTNPKRWASVLSLHHGASKHEQIQNNSVYLALIRVRARFWGVGSTRREGETLYQFKLPAKTPVSDLGLSSTKMLRLSKYNTAPAQG